MRSWDPQCKPLRAFIHVVTSYRIGIVNNYDYDICRLLAINKLLMSQLYNKIYISQAKEGQSICVPCNMGWHANTTGSIDCVMCDVGFHTDGPGAIDCVECPPGTFSSL